MKGWKTKIGVCIGVIGGGLIAGADVAPTPELNIWLKFIGTILISIGGGFATYGVAHKVEKLKMGE